jgi:hypothetical protein
MDLSLRGVSRSHTRDPYRRSEFLGLAPIYSVILSHLLPPPL